MGRVPAGQVDADDEIARPDVGVDGPVDAFELVEMIQRLPVERDRDRPHDAEVLRTADREIGGAVAHHERLSVVTQAPPLAAVRQLALSGKRRAIVQQRESILPGELDESIADERKSLGEDRRRDVYLPD